MASKTELKCAELTIIVPVYNEETIISLFREKLDAVLADLSNKTNVHLIFVNNGSTDKTLFELYEWQNSPYKVSICTLSRNFGYETALIAGLHRAESDFYCLIDGDGEDPVNLLPVFFEKIETGVDLVQGIRIKRHESFMLSKFRSFAYWFLSKTSDEPFRRNAGNFAMFNLEIRNAILRENSIYPFLRGTLSRVGFETVLVEHNRDPRLGGRSKYRKLRLLQFAFLGYMTTSTFPLRLVFYSWVFVTIPFVLVKPLCLILGIPNTPATSVYVLILGNQILMSLATISIYLARVFKYVLGRPLYYINEKQSCTFND